MLKLQNPWRYVFQIGLISSIAILYMGVIGMIATFHEREMIREVGTLGQLLILLPPFMLAYTAARRLRQQFSLPSLLAAGAIVGLLTAVLTIVFLFLNESLELRDILVNVNRDWVDVMTFDNRDNLVTGSLLLALITGVAGLVGGLLAILPDRLRNATSFALAVTLLVGLFGETLTIALSQTLPDEFIDAIFRRGTLLVPAALVIFVLSFIGHLLWSSRPQAKVVEATAVNTPARRNAMLVWYAVLIAFLVALPWLAGRALSDILVTVGLYLLMGLGLNIAIGLTGMLDLGYVTNYAVGAYVMAVLTTNSELNRGGGLLNFWLVIPIAIIITMATRFLLTLPVLKMRGDYLAIATLGFGEIIGTLANSDWLAPVVGGAQGVLFIPNPNFLGTNLVDPQQLYYVVLVACILFLIISVRLNNSRIGRQWMAVREDEDVARAMGIDVTRSKLLSLTLAAAAGGLAGAIFAAKVGTVFPNSFTIFVSINVLALIIVGGLGSIPGVVVGALALVGMPDLLREFTEYRWLIYGALLIWMMLNRPEGLMPSQSVKREMQTDENAPARAGAGD
jgi:branched-chain amino acid transport system permease protein